MHSGDPTQTEAQHITVPAALGDILLRTEAVAFRWRAAPGWPVELVSDNVRNWGLDPRALQRGEPPYSDLVHPEDLARIAAEVEAHTLQGPDHFRQEYRLRNGVEGWRWVEDHTWIERDDAGHAIAFNGVLIDVTERKIAELGLEIVAGVVPALLDPAPRASIVQRVLQRLGAGVGADRAYIFEVHPSEDQTQILASQRYEWCQDGIAPQIQNPQLQNLAFEERFPRWLTLLRGDQAVIGRIADFPADERQLLEAQAIQSVLVVPVTLRGRLWGFLGFDAVTQLRAWSTSEERVLRVTAAALGATIEQERMVEALRESEERLRLALDAGGAGAWEWRFDRPNVWSDRHYEILGLRPGALEASYQGWLARVHPEDRDWLTTEMAHARSENRGFAVEYRIVHPDGVVRWVHSVGKPRFAADGSMTGMVGILIDIDERKKNEERLRLSAAVIDSTRDGVVVTDLSAHIITVNRAYCEITGYSEAELLGKNPRILQSGRHDDRFYQQMWAALAGQGHWQGEIWSRRRNGEVYPEWLTISAVRDENARVRHYVGVVTDISRLKQTEAELARLAHYDPLTGLPNRLLAQSRLDHAILRAERESRRLALLFIDMDRFKTVNDSLGHQVGDQLLHAVGKRLSKAVRGGDTVARLGGDEFMVISEECQTGRAAGELATTLLESLHVPFHLEGGHEVFVDASIGISLYPEDGASSTDLVRCADAAMYRAKDLGRNTFHFYTPNLVDAASDRLELENRLRHALSRNEFEVHYQPLLTCDTSELIGVEALVRWRPPGEPLIQPGRFIALAEETGLIGALGDWVLETACRQVQRWRRAGIGGGELRLAVNLSARQLRQPEFPDRVTRVLSDSGLDPDALELEITESMLMEHGSMVIGTLHALRSLGVRVAIDDFGTGYSSLAYLRRLPLDTLKIDRSFVADIPGHEDGAEIAAAIIALAHQLHLEVLAEGVESTAQLSFLQEQGCDYFQGFLVSPAIPADEFTQRFGPRAPSSTLP